MNMKRKFRFEDLEIWQEAISIADKLFDIADVLEGQKKYKWAEQLHGAGLSISNIIAEGSASSSKKDFSNFLNMAKRSAFENANMLYLFGRRRLITEQNCDSLRDELDVLCRKISNFQKWLSRHTIV